MGDDLQRGASDEAITDRHKLRPLVDPKDDIDDVNVEVSKSQTTEVSLEIFRKLDFDGNRRYPATQAITGSL
jgi:hypothetical protein